MLTQIILSTLSPDELQGLISSSVKRSLEAGLSQIKQPEAIQVTEDFLKLPDVCRLFKVTSVTVHSWKKKGILPFHRIGRRIFFKRSEVLDAMKKINNKRF